MEEKNKKLVWYDNANVLTNIILVSAIVVIVISQSMAVNSDVNAIVMLRNLLNHNLTYIAALVYFVLLKTKVGRRNFNLINVVYICLYVLNTIASVFTIIQSFSLSSIFALVLNVLVLSYMCTTFLPETRIWNDFGLNKLSLQEIKNDWFFTSIAVVGLLLMLVNLITVVNFYGIILTLFDTIYIILFARYIYLYKKYNDDSSLNDVKEDKLISHDENSIVKKVVEDTSLKEKDKTDSEEEKNKKNSKKKKKKDDK